MPAASGESRETMDYLKSAIGQHAYRKSLSPVNISLHYAKKQTPAFVLAAMDLFIHFICTLSSTFFMPSSPVRTRSSLHPSPHLDFLLTTIL